MSSVEQVHYPQEQHWEIVLVSIISFAYFLIPFIIYIVLLSFVDAFMKIIRKAASDDPLAEGKATEEFGDDGPGSEGSNTESKTITDNKPCFISFHDIVYSVRVSGGSKKEADNNGVIGNPGDDIENQTNPAEDESSSLRENEDNEDDLEGGQAEVRREVSKDTIVSADCNIQEKKGKTSIKHHSRLNILKGVSGYFKPGTLNAIMGPSGCGKSTLLDVLANRKETGKTEGLVLINGSPRPPPKDYNKIAAYVMQNDCLFANLTVRETLLFVAEFRLSNSSDTKSKLAIVDSAIRDLDLGRVANTKIGSGSVGGQGLSGGQKRRVTVAIELVPRPTILFLDEPTSGLDAYSSQRLTEVLKRLAGSGHTILCTIHQPRSDIFKLFDSLYLMKAGKTMYFGPVNGVKEFFFKAGVKMSADENPADFVVDLTHTKEEGETQMDFCSFYDSSRQCSETTEKLGLIIENKYDEMPAIFEVDHKTSHSGFNHQVLALTLRAYMNGIRNDAYISNWFLGGITFLFYGALFSSVKDNFSNGSVSDEYDSYNTQASMIYMLLAAMFFNENVNVSSIYLERAIFLREYRSGTYSIESHHMAWFLRLMFSAFVKGFLYTPLAYFLGRFPVRAVTYVTFTLFMMATNAIGSAVAMFCASLFGTLSSSAAGFVTINIVTQNLSGFFIFPTLIGWWLRWMYYMSFFKYALEGSYINVFEDDSFNNGTQPVLGVIIKVDDSFNQWGNLGILLIYPLFFHFLAYLATHWRYNANFLPYFKE